MTRTATAIAAVALAALSLTSATHAQERVSFDPADLRTAEGVEALYTAITDAAETACRRANAHVSAYGPSVRRRAIEACVADTVEATVRDVGAPVLTARHEGGEGQPMRFAMRNGR